MSKRLLLIAALIAVAIVSRFIPHPPNFTAVGAIALFAGATLADRRWAYGLPMLAMFLSDCLLGFHSLMPFVYGAMLLYVVLGQWSRRGQRVSDLPLMKVAGASLAGSVAFFVITNAGCWWLYYDHSLAGATTCFTAAIPFFQWTIAGDVIFATALFGGLAMVEQRHGMPATVPATAN